MLKDTLGPLLKGSGLFYLYWFILLRQDFETLPGQINNRRHHSRYRQNETGMNLSRQIKSVIQLLSTFQKRTTKTKVSIQ